MGPCTSCLYITAGFAEWRSPHEHAPGYISHFCGRRFAGERRLVKCAAVLCRNPHMDLQAQARAHRLGQTRAVMIYRCAASWWPCAHLTS